MRHPQVLKIAKNLVTTLSSYCEKIDIGGSVRRMVYYPNDLEIVALPKREISQDLFGLNKEEFVNLPFIIAVNKMGIKTKGIATGRYCQIRLPEGINLDLFMPKKSDYYRQLVIRTGSAEYVHRVIARGWREIGWVGTKDGLRLKDDCTHTSKHANHKWKCVNPNPQLPPSWDSEEAFYEWLKVRYVPPEHRGN